MQLDELVSVIITTYKRKADILNRAIESVENQTYNNIEIIVVDDNSNDDMFRKNIKEYMANKKNIVYIEHKENYGAQVSRNDGIKISNGKYCAFLDDDDTWLPKKIEMQMQTIKEYDAEMAFCKGYIIEEKSKKVENYYNEMYLDREPSFQDLLKEDCIGTTSQALISKDCLEKVRFI